MIKLENIQKVFRTEEVETVALGGVSFEVKKGEFVAIMGPQAVASQPCSTFWDCSTIPPAALICWMVRTWDS